MPADNRASWNAVSRDYQSIHRIPTDDAHYGPRMPTERELQLVGDVAGKRLLEIGCGGGQCAIAFAKRGAIASGKDLSEEQLAFARALAQREGVNVEFTQGNIEDLSEFENESQGVVFSAWALPFVENLGRCFREVYRVLVSGGIFVFSSDHPFGAAISDGSPPLVVKFGYWDTARDWHWDDDPSKPRFREFSRPVSETFQLLRDAGFAVDRILEPRPLEHERDTWDSSYPMDRLKLVPATIIFRAIKP
jgi:ubiquinone/menaquinone biosynthesis C-methylase UbiE